MWIMSNKSFLSIVEDKNNPENLMVRARIKGDIEAIFPSAIVNRTPEADYLYRTSLSKKEVAMVIAENIMNVDYLNFKDTVKEDDRHNQYLRVWSTMYNWQENNRPDPWYTHKYYNMPALESAKAFDNYGLFDSKSNILKEDEDFNAWLMQTYNITIYDYDVMNIIMKQQLDEEYECIHSFYKRNS